MLDMHFFEKCFFGKKLSIKDQIVFRVYANQLLDLVKNNLNKDLRKKYQFYLLKKKMQKKINNNRNFQKSQKNSRKKAKSRSRSPVSQNENDLEKYRLLGKMATS